MHKCCGKQDASSKMSGEEEESWWDAELWISYGEQRKYAGAEGDEKNDKHGTDMECEVVVPASAAS